MIRTCTKSKLVQSALIVFNEWGSQEVNLFDGASTVEVEWIVGPIPIDDNIGKNIIILYDTDIASTSKYYTDANGREVLERIRDYRPTWNYTVVENISSNYYPINSRIWIKDQQRQFTVLTGIEIFINYSPRIFHLCKHCRTKESENKLKNITLSRVSDGRLE
jgi:lysosomal alpha-mannosidase